ncbi:hypothetical protein EW145_g3752 [Phellinidium pouzarii]|uniref:Uncharacterized protein n=1 Tax=Phellinidium pouzarii TaxID=167371 RepID=A0A4S4L7G0_9AGAM|nr:hypothetical protein EW145_g3752 [Phellinidium pouzarii]
MRSALLLSLLAVPILAMAQSSNSSSGNQSVVVSTILSTSVGVDGNHQQITQVISSVVTQTLSASPASNTSSSNSSSSGNGTSSGNTTTSSKTPASPLPTATASIDGGGDGPGGAPSPGASASGGMLGPPDSFTAAALSLSVNTAFTIVAGVAGGLHLMWS